MFIKHFPLHKAPRFNKKRKTRIKKKTKRNKTNQLVCSLNRTVGDFSRTSMINCHQFFIVR